VLVHVEAGREKGGLAGPPDALEHGDEAILVDRRPQVEERLADDFLSGLALDPQACGVESLDDVVATPGAIPADLVDRGAARHVVEEAAQEALALAQCLLGALALGDVADGGHMHRSPLAQEEAARDLHGEDRAILPAMDPKRDDDHVVRHDGRPVGHGLRLLGLRRQILVGPGQQFVTSESVRHTFPTLLPRSS
jgi:hypothetical protein